MVRENQFINIITIDDIKNYKTVQLTNCIIDTVDLIGAFELNVKLIIKNCIIQSFQIHSCWFVNGLILKNSIINNLIDYQMGGHNVEPIVIEGNIFRDFFNFFDCQFDNIIELKNNVLGQGTNLLGNAGEGFENAFSKGWIIENNVGNVNLNR